MSKMSTSEAMISAAYLLRLGAAEHIVAQALRSDGVLPEKVDTVLRWCKLYNERTNEHEQAVEDDQGSVVQDQDDLYGA